MKLEGSLDAFSLPDIFQLLSFTKKTGGLHLAQGAHDGVVFFGGGLITGASADSSRQPLARRLIGAGVVDDDALRAAVEAATQGHGVGVARALLDNGTIEAGMLRQAVTDQTVDAVFDLLRWTDGAFAFVLDEPNPDDVGVTLVAETVVADANARQGSWQAVSALVPSSDAVPAMPIVLQADPELSREEWSLLAFVDGRRTVGELVDLTGSGQYAVVSLLAGLVRRGLLEVRDETTTDHVGVVLRRQRLLAPLEGMPFTPIVDPSAGPSPFEAHLQERAQHPVAEPGDVPADSTDEPATSDRVLEEAAAPGPSEPAEHKHHAEPATFEPTSHDTFPGDDSEGADLPAPAPAYGDEREPVTSGAPTMLGGAHLPADVVPPRPEPYLPRRQAEFDDGGMPPSGSSGAARHVAMHAGGVPGDVMGSSAVAIDPETASVIERDPNVNRSLMLRLIAGVRGL